VWASGEVRSKRRAALALLVLSLALMVPARAAAPLGPAQGLKLSSFPSTLPADGRSYPALLVQLVDAAGNPVVALSDVTVYLSSATEYVGRPQPTATIRLGSYFTLVNFTTSTTPGSTQVTASAPGLASGSVSITTARPSGYPSKIRVGASPELLGPGMQGFVLVEVLDDRGLPAPAVASITVTLNSSNPSVVQLSQAQLTVQRGSFWALGSYATGYVPGTALITATSPGFAPDAVQVTVRGATPYALSMSAQPSTMAACLPPLAPQACSGRLIIALTDLGGRPVRAPQDIAITLTSSNMSVVRVPPTVTIPRGELYAVATYQTTQLNGSAVIAASAMGLKSALLSITTVNPSARPTRLKLYSAPDPLLADNRAYHALVVALLDKEDKPAVATTDVEVHLTSSDASILTLRASVIIPKNFSASQPVDLITTFLPGATQLTASAENFVPDQLTISTFGPVASSIALRPVLPDLPANGGRYRALEIALRDASGLPAVAPAPGLAISLYSSRAEVASAAQTVLIPAGQSFALVEVATSVTAGQANFTAVASFANHTAVSWTLLSTFSPSPSKLSLYAAPQPALMVPKGALVLLAVQLQDDQGNPAKARQDIPVLLSPANSSLVGGLLNITIAQGENYALVPLRPLGRGETELTASAQGLASSSTSLIVLPLPLQASLAASPTTLYINGTSTLRLSVLLQGWPLQGANVSWAVSSGSLSASSSVLAEDGGASVQYIPSQPGPVRVNATVSHPALGPITVSSSLYVLQLPPPPPKPLVLRLLSFPYLAIWPALAAGAIVALLMKRRRGGEQEEEGLPS